MRLQDYLDQQHVSPADFAASIGVSRQAVDRYRMGQRIPEPHVMVRIAEQTENAVQPNDFYDLRPSRSRRRAHSSARG